MQTSALQTIRKAGADLTDEELRAVYAIRAQYMRPKNSAEQDWEYFYHHVREAQYIFLFADANGEIQGSSLVHCEVKSLDNKEYLAIELGLGYLRGEHRGKGYPNQAVLTALLEIYEQYPSLPKYFLGVAFAAGYLVFRPLGLKVYHLDSQELSAFERGILREYSLSQYGDGISPVCNSILVPIVSPEEIQKYAQNPSLQEFMQYVPNWYEGYALYILARLPQTLAAMQT